jgi:chloramphenicol-sensitive protein RarD
MGFLQFIYPSITFCLGLAVGERPSPMGALSFLFIWAGAAVFGYGAWRAGRRARLTA